MEDYKPNSNLSKAQELKKKEKVVSNPVKVRKKSSISRFTGAFVQEDTQNVKNYIVFDVLIPALKKLFEDVVTNALHMSLYGDDGRASKSRSPMSNVIYGSFRNYSQNDRRSSVVRSSGYDFDEIIMRTRGEAEDVLMRLDEIIDTYRVATVADFYEAADVSAPYTANRYGWTDLRSASVVRVRDGYIVKLPKAMPID